MSDGPGDCYRMEEIERNKEKQALKERLAQVYEQYKWIMIEDMVKEINDEG